MTIYIARDGAEIGECDRADLAQLAREGQVLSSDHYWHEGMENWRLVGDLLTPPPPPKTQEPRPVHRVLKPMQTEEEPRERENALERTVQIAMEPTMSTQPAKEYRDPKELLRKRRKVPREAPNFDLPKSKRRVIACSVAGLLFVALGLFLFFALRAERGARTSLFPSNPTTAAPSEIEIRDKAAADLKEKIERLPGQPAPPLYTFFYDMEVNMKKSLSTRVPWWALVRGGENVVDPETQKTIKRTDFILTIEYRDGDWFFKHYRASAKDMVKDETREIEDDEKTIVPPSIVGMLGVKMPR